MVDRSQTMMLINAQAPTARRRLIVNADDFGFTEGVTEGILQCMCEGIVTSTTVMANMPFASESIRRLLAVGCRSVGIHLNLTSGSAIRTRSRRLTSPNGTFLGAGVLWRDGMLQRLPVEEIEQELAAQIVTIRSMGIEVSHVDSHHHIHVLPQIAPVVAKLCNRFMVPAVRVPYTKGHHLSSLNRLKWQLVNFNAGRARRTFQDYGLQMPDHFVAWYGGGADTLEDLQRTLMSIGTGVTEIAVHPGIDDVALAALDSYLSERRAEQIALCDAGLQKYLKDLEITLTNFHSVCA
jgi:predicted glycoside hydrolase/deacetylase ChbG (UPF0249 family)